MPTGYTQCIEKGVTFKDFALNCARAFGACVTLRDNSTAPIPKEFKPSDYHKKEAAKNKKRYEQVKKLSTAMCSAEAEREYTVELANRARDLQRNTKLRKAYEDMRTQVNEWKCPDTHVELKNFMINQIDISVDSDDYYKKELEKIKRKGALSGEAWRTEKLSEIQRDIRYDMDEYQKEVERVADRNKWLKELRESLK